MENAVRSETATVAGERFGRNAVVIVVAGIALGLAFNYFGRTGRPEGGLAWIAEPKSLDSVEALLGSPPTAPSGGPNGVAAGVTGSAVEPTSVGGSDPSAPTRPAPAAGVAATASAVPAGNLSPGDLDDPLGGAVTVAPTSGVPEIPDVGRPLKVELALVKALADGDAALIVDARDPDEYADGHIPGALNLPYSQVITDPPRLQGLDPGGKPIVVYCGGGTCEASMSLAEALVYQAGKRRVLVFHGGYPEWVDAGYPVEKPTAAGDRG